MHRAVPIAQTGSSVERCAGTPAAKVGGSVEGFLKGFVLHSNDKEDERTNAANDELLLPLQSLPPTTHPPYLLHYSQHHLSKVCIRMREPRTWHYDVALFWQSMDKGCVWIPYNLPFLRGEKDWPNLELSHAFVTSIFKHGGCCV